MIEWLLLPGTDPQPLRALLARAWSGTAQVRVLQPTRKSREILVVVPEGAGARRQARWPDVLTDWADIYEEPLFGPPRCPVAGEIVSESLSDCLALLSDLGDPAGARAAIAWYEKGALRELEQVGKAAVSWRPGQPLSRPSASGARAQLASMGRAMADEGRDESLYERVEAGLSATAEALLMRALIRLLADDPPPLTELASAILAAPGARLSL